MKNLEFILHENVDNFGLSETPKSTLGYKFEQNGQQYGDYIVMNSPFVTVSDVMDGLGSLCKSLEKTLCAINSPIKKKLATPDPEAVAYDTPFKKTVEGMLSANYKERFIAEYQQSKIRYEKLKAFNTKIEAAREIGAVEPEHDCPYELLRDQQRIMGDYLHVLEIRSVIEGVDLTSI